jgi:hypothetical protein
MVTPAAMRFPRIRFSLRKLPRALSGVLALVTLLSGQQQQPSKEYIRIGGRVVAVENPVASTVTVCPPSPTVGMLDTLQLTASATSGCTPTSAATWTLQDGSPGAATIGNTSGVLTPTTAGTVSVQATIGSLVSHSTTVTISSVFSVPSIAAASNGQLLSGGSEQFTVTKQGSWTLQSPGVQWFQFAGANPDGSFSGSGTMNVGYSILPNSTSNQLNLTLTLNGTTNGSPVTATLGVTEVGSGSTLLPPSVTPTTVSLAGSNDTLQNNNGKTNSFAVQVTYQNIAWWINESSLPGWIYVDQNSVAFTNSSSPQTASGIVTFDFNANSSSSVRTSTGQVCIADSSSSCVASVTVNQAGGVTFNPQTAPQLASGGGSGTVGVIAPAGTPWTAVVPNPADAAWLSVSAPASGPASQTTPLTYTALANPAGNSTRSGVITIGGLWYTVQQAGTPGVVNISGGPTFFTQQGTGTFFASLNGVQQSATWTLTTNCGASLSSNFSPPLLTTTGASVTYYAPEYCGFAGSVDTLEATVSGAGAGSINIILNYPGGQGAPTLKFSNQNPPTAYYNFELILPAYTSANASSYTNTTIAIVGTPPTGNPFAPPLSSCTMLTDLANLSTSALALENDGGTGYVPSPVYVVLAINGTQASPQSTVPFNSQCELDPTFPFTSLSDPNQQIGCCNVPSSTGLSVNAGLRFRPGFAANNPSGYTIWMEANGAGVTAVNPVQLGTWSSLSYQPPTISWSTAATPAGSVGPTVSLIGWAYDNATQPEGPISNVQIQVDGTTIQTITTLGAAPADGACPGSEPPLQPSGLANTNTLWNCGNTTNPNNANIGWSYSWDTTTVTNAPHTVTVIATDSDPTPHTASVSRSYTPNNPTAAPPNISPAAGSYPGQLSVTLTVPGSMSGLNAVIYYTTNGSTPTRSSTLYTTPFLVTQNTTVNAIVHAPTYIDSPVASASYVLQVGTPVMNPGTGTYPASQSVVITSGTQGATVIYTTDGTTPTHTHGSSYSTPIPVSSTTTIKALAFLAGMTDSPVASATLTIVPPVAAPAFSPVPGTYNLGENVSITSATANASIRYTTDGVTVPTETAGTLYSGPISVASTKTIQAIAFESGMADSPVISATYTIVPAEQIVTPAPAVGMSVNFTVQDEDIASAADVSVVGMLVGNDWNSTQNACYFQVYIVGGPTTSYVQFFNNDGVTYQTAYLSNLSPSAPLSNSQCSLQGVTFSPNGSQFIWSPMVTLTSAFAALGSPNVFTYMQTQEGFSAWETATTWNPTGATALMGAAKVGILRDGFLWLLDANGDEQFSTPPDFAYAFGGLAGDIPITGDWTGSGTTKIGILRTAGGILQFLLDSNGDGVFGTGDAVYNFGTYVSGDLPVVGDWNGDGRTKIGIFREGFFWMLDYNGNGTWDGTGPGADVAFAFGGIAGDMPVVGDWTGDGKSKVGVFRDGFEWLLSGSDPSAATQTALPVFAFGGIPGDLPIVGDWTGDGITKAGVFRDGFLWVLDGADATAPQASHFVLFGFAFGGVTGDVPVSGRWVN